MDVRILIIVALTFVSPGCGDDESPNSPVIRDGKAAWVFDVADDPAPLTSRPGDKCFTLTVVSAGPIYLGELNKTSEFALPPIVNINVSAANLRTQLSGRLDCTRGDNNSNEVFDTGDSISCSERSRGESWERSDDMYDETTVGHAVSLSIYEYTPDASHRFANDVWTPVN